MGCLESKGADAGCRPGHELTRIKQKNNLESGSGSVLWKLQRPRIRAALSRFYWTFVVVAAGKSFKRSAVRSLFEKVGHVRVSKRRIAD